LRQIILEKDMKRVMKSVCTMGLVGCAVLGSQLAMAADSGWFAGANLGQSKARIDDARISARLQGSGLGVSRFQEDERDLGGKVFGGYKFNPNFALEAGYFNLGRFEYTATTVPAGSLAGRLKVQGLNIDAVGILPFTEEFSGFGRVGLNYAQSKSNFVGTGAVPASSNSSHSKRDLNYKLGLGLQYDFTNTVGMRAEWERYRINDAVGNNGDIDLVSLGVVFMFGGGNTEPALK
jgi:OmpA-OmpF porin, OOP family